MEPKKRNFHTIDEAPRKAIPEFKHGIAIQILELHLKNFEMELINKRKVINEILSDRTQHQGPVQFLGIKIRLLKIEIRRVKRSIRLLTKYNKPIESSYELARSSTPL